MGVVCTGGKKKKTRCGTSGAVQAKTSTRACRCRPPTAFREISSGGRQHHARVPLHQPAGGDVARGSRASQGGPHPQRGSSQLQAANYHSGSGGRYEATTPGRRGGAPLCLHAASGLRRDKGAARAPAVPMSSQMTLVQRQRRLARAGRSPPTRLPPTPTTPSWRLVDTS